MVERRELITIFRQISSMMEAGVDIRRIIRVLSAQTENPRLLSLYDELDHDLRMGKSLADAMERASDVFSPFAISLVRTSEDPYNTKNTQDLAGTFYRIADFLQKEEEVSGSHHAGPTPHETPVAAARPYFSMTAPVLTVHALDGLIDRIQVAALRTLTLTAGLLLSLAAVWWSVEVQLVERRWLAVTLCSVAALFIAGAGVWVRRQLERERKREIRCSFCGQTSTESGAPLKQASRFTSTAICVRCAEEFARQLEAAESPEGAAAAPRTAAPAAEARAASAGPQAGASSPRETTVPRPAGSQGPAEAALQALPAQVVTASPSAGAAANGNTTASRTVNGQRASQPRPPRPQADGEATYE